MAKATDIATIQRYSYAAAVFEYTRECVLQLFGAFS